MDRAGESIGGLRRRELPILYEILDLPGGVAQLDPRGAFDDWRDATLLTADPRTPRIWHLF